MTVYYDVCMSTFQNNVIIAEKYVILLALVSLMFTDIM